MIPAIILFVITIVGKLIFDLALYRDGRANAHTLGPFIVLAVLIVCSVLGGWWSVPMWFFGWWVLYDNLYGILIGQDIFYIGTTARLDRLQRSTWAIKRHGKVIVIPTGKIIVAFKYIGFVSSLILYIWMQ